MDLTRVVFFRFDVARDRQPQVTEFHAQGLPSDSQQESGLLEIPACVLQDAWQQQPVHLLVRVSVQVTDVRPDPLVDDESLHAGFFRCRRRRGCDTRPSQRFGQEGRQQDGAAGLEQCLLQDALQLADVARPRVTAQPLSARRNPVLYEAKHRSGSCRYGPCFIPIQRAPND